MKLLDNWKEIITKAWSVRLAALATLFTSMQQMLPYLPAYLVGLTVEQSTAIGTVFGTLGALFAALVALVRVFDQGIGE